LAEYYDIPIENGRISSTHLANFAGGLLGAYARVAGYMVGNVIRMPFTMMNSITSSVINMFNGQPKKELTLNFK
jgi:p-aminobenzoyl-glutamate transporter AbgT